MTFGISVFSERFKRCYLLHFTLKLKFYNKMQHTKYEEARIIGARALQIAQGAPFIAKISDKELEKIRYNPIEIAKMEFSQGIVPIRIKHKQAEVKGGAKK